VAVVTQREFLRLVLVCIGALVCWVTSALAQADSVVVLNPPLITNGLVQLSFTGEAGVAYAVSQSTNLQDWLPVTTNSGAEILRVIETPVEADAVYYRIARGPLPLFSSAIMGLQDVKLFGSFIRSDSFNSTNVLFNTNGWYDSTKALSNGHVASVTGIISVGNAKIYGDVITGPTGSYSIGLGLVSGQYRSKLNLYLPDVVVPSYDWSPPTITNVNQQVDGITYAYAFGYSGNYSLGTYNGSIHVGSNAVVRLLVSGTANGSVLIQRGGVLTIYMAGDSYNFSSGVFNQNPSASSFQYFGLQSNTNVSMGPTTGGVLIYAPQAALTVSVGGVGSDFIGAIVSKSVSVNGRVAFHFDESLLSTGPMR